MKPAEAPEAVEEDDEVPPPPPPPRRPQRQRLAFAHSGMLRVHVVRESVLCLDGCDVVDCRKRLRSRMAACSTGAPRTREKSIYDLI